MRARLDAELVRRHLVGTRSEARAAIEAGLVTVSGRPAVKPSTLVEPGEAVHVAGAPRRFVSRGGEKLEGALRRFGLDVEGANVLDAGASAGGFTDCLLRAGAARVAAVDVGRGQLDWSLRSDDRVSVLERTNVRSLRPSDLPFAPDVVVADLSFISLTHVLPALAGVAQPGAALLLLVKPQFEAGRDKVSRGGVVRDPAVWLECVERVSDAAADCGLRRLDVAPSPLLGPAGNAEFFLLFRKETGPVAGDPTQAIKEALALVEAS